jgi:hypothetical protein
MRRFSLFAASIVDSMSSKLVLRFLLLFSFNSSAMESTSKNAQENEHDRQNNNFSESKPKPQSKFRLGILPFDPLFAYIIVIYWLTR